MKLQRYLVRVVRPVFQTTYVEVVGRGERDAAGRCFETLREIPETQWSGRYNPDEHALDLYPLHVLETEEGYPYTLLGFAQYSILSTDLNPYMHADGIEMWMREVVHPLLLAGGIWEWIEKLREAREGYYQKAIEHCEELLREWRGTGNKIVSLKPPADRRDDIKLLETTLACLRLLKEID
jgi:hypothetical protein